MATKYALKIAFLMLGVLLIASCNLPGMTVMDVPTQIPPDAIYTAAALTLQAQLTMNAPPTLAPTFEVPTNPPPMDTMTPTMTFTPILFTDTPVATATLPFTPTSTFPLITANIDTNCRKGPAPEYERVGYLLVGEVSEVLGKNSSGTWWYIKNPKNPSVLCWVWGKSTTVSGSTVELAIITPPPPPASPTPGKANFSAAYVGTKKCGGDRHAIFSVKVTGGSGFESMSIKTHDQDTSLLISGATASNAPFMTGSGKCPPGEDTLEPGTTAYVAGNIAGAPAGHNAKTSITLCTKDNLGGTCVAIIVKYKFP